MAPGHALMAAEVGRLAQSALGLAAPPAVRPVAGGGEHHSWWVGEAFVARLAPNPEASVRQRREIALRDLLRPRLPVPSSVASGEWAPGCSFSIDTRLPGLSAESRPVSALGETDLAGLLSALRTETGPAAALGVPVQPLPAWSELALRFAASARRLAEAGEVPAGLRLPVVDLDSSARVLVHGDLKGEHLLVNESGGISGVLDWTDAELADPATDIAGLAISVGAAAATRSARIAGYDDRTCTRGFALARVNTLTLLDDRLRGLDDSPLPLLRAQLSRAWELVPLRC